jgi:glycerol-3-phosphate O-acyltransferase
MPSVIARILTEQSVLSKSAIFQLLADILPFAKEEFPMEYTDADLEAGFNRTLAAMANTGLVRHGGNGDVYQAPADEVAYKQLKSMGRFLGAAIDLPAIVLEIMRIEGDRSFTAAEVDGLVQKAIEVQAAADGQRSEGAIGSAMRVNTVLLKKLQLIKTGLDGRFQATEKARVVAARWSGMLSAEVKESIKQAIKDSKHADGKVEA